MMLEALDARDESEAPPRKTSAVDVPPPWESASRKASRRENVSVGAK